MIINVLESGSNGNCTILTDKNKNQLVLDCEEWRDVKGWDGFYQISSKGRLKRVSKNGEYIYKMTNKYGDYFSVVLKNKNKQKSTRIHRLVAETFISNPLKLSQVNHKDGNKQNNNVENLEWVTPLQNIRHAKLNNLITYNHPYKYSKNYISILQYTLDGLFIKEYENAKVAMNETGVCARNILQVAHKTPFNKNGNIRKQAGGFVWKLKKGGDIN